VRVALVAGLVLIAAAAALTLSRAPLVLAGTNSVAPKSVVGATYGGVHACQEGETVPAGTTAVRFWMAGNIKPRVQVALLAGARTVATGTTGGGWLGKVTTVAVGRVPQTLHDAQLCFSIARAVQVVDLFGESGSRTARGRSVPKMRVEYLRPGPSSWWSLVGSVARRVGLGRAPAGALVFLIPLVAMALALILVAGTILRVLGRGGRAGASPRRVPGAAWICACVAILSAASWSIVTPPFQAPDEPSHFAYAQIVAETGGLPRSPASVYSAEETTALTDLDHQAVRFNQAIGAISTSAQQRRLEHDLALPLSRRGVGAGVASPQPPLYYALQAIPYLLGSGGTLLDQLELMRLLSALMAGAAALFVFLFLREALPAVPWAWTVGGLCTALAPLVGFISGVVNPDAMLCAVSAALFYCLARGFRRGLTRRLAIAIGAVTAIGFLTKLNFIGLAPGALLALVLLARRAARTSGRSAYGSLAAAVAIGWGPSCLYVLINVLSNHAPFGLLSTGLSGTTAHHGSPLQELSYVWQFYLPRLPGMTSYFPGVSTTLQFWFDRAVGVYGWLDTHFPGWVYEVALVPAGLIAALCVRELVRRGGALRARAGELISYAAIAAGLLALIGADSYLEFPAYPAVYSEPRYLLPLAVLFAAVLALAARGAGRRWGPAVGTLIVLLIFAHDVFSQLLEVGRFYG
jgi:hypothetical protein